MNIKIGDKNKIKNSNVGHTINSKGNSVSERKKISEKHPILIGAFISFMVGFILLFSFWDKVVGYVENLF